MLFCHTAELLSVSPASNQPADGRTLVIIPGQEGSKDDYPSFRVFIDLGQSGGASSPTTDVVVETSHDGTSWVSLLDPIQLTADGTVHKFEALEAIGPMIRARTVLGGGTKPSHTARVKLASNAPFQVIQR